MSTFADLFTKITDTFFNTRSSETLPPPKEKNKERYTNETQIYMKLHRTIKDWYLLLSQENKKPYEDNIIRVTIHESIEILDKAEDLFLSLDDQETANEIKTLITNFNEMLSKYNRKKIMSGVLGMNDKLIAIKDKVPHPKLDLPKEPIITKNVNIKNIIRNLSTIHDAAEEIIKIAPKSEIPDKTIKKLKELVKDSKKIEAETTYILEEAAA